MQSGPPSRSLLDQLPRHRGLAALLRSRPFQQPPGDDHRPLGRDADQADQAIVVAQAAAVDGIDLAPDEPAPVEGGHGGFLDAKPSRGLDAAERVPQGVGVAGQRLGSPPLGVAMPPIVAGLDLGGCPSQAEQDGRLPKEQPCRWVETRLGQER